MGRPLVGPLPRYVCVIYWQGQNWHRSARMCPHDAEHWIQRRRYAYIVAWRKDALTLDLARLPAPEDQ